MAALELRQQLRLSQQLIMTPQLQQAIKLLQLSRLELLETIHQELEINPMLEEMQEESGENADELDEPREPVEEFKEIQVLESMRQDFDWESYLDEYNTGTPVLFETDPNRESPSYDYRLTLPDTLQEHLFWQMRLSDMTESDKEIGMVIIGNLNGDGYLDASLEEIATMAEVSVKETEQVLAKVQVFDPVGVGARNLQECLLIQAKNLNLDDDLVVSIIEHHLHYLENKNFQGLVRVLKRTPEEVKLAVALILGLNPRPGSAFSEESVNYISPDIYVFKVDKDFVILLNEDGLPKLRVSSYYREALSQDAVIPTDAKDFIHNKLRSAAWLIKSIHQRQRTLYKVGHSIVKLQRDFFEKGVAFLKPMVLRDVAEDVGMHESTISRVTSNKYMDTPHGIFELKYFFNSSINSFLGEAVASESVKERIRQLIKGEDSSKPYSDQEIVDILEGENIRIARRTVAKYREMLSILPSSKRRKSAWG
jgi:RNA polymerase sigma-54 factor